MPPAVDTDRAQGASALGTMPGVAVGKAVAVAAGEGGGAVVGAVVGTFVGDAEGEWVAADPPPMPGAVQAPRRANVAIPATHLMDLVSGTADKLTGKPAQRRAVQSSKASSVPTSWPAVTER
jgi:hypothetical protein